MAGERPGHAAADPYQAAVDALDDPLGDPLPGQRGPAAPGHRGPAGAPADGFGGYPADAYPAGDGAYPGGEFGGGEYAGGEFAGGGEYPHETYDYEPAFDVFAPRAKEADPETMGLQVRPPRREHDPETVGLRRPEDLRRIAADDDADAEAGSGAASDGGASGAEGGGGASGAEGGGRAARRRAAEPERPGGRAARRKAARGGGRRGGAAAEPAGEAATPAEAEITGGRAARRKAAKAAAKAARQTGTAISNVIGELFITTGVLLLLFVVYQLWWTNVEARAHADGQANELQERWDESGGDEGNDENRDPGVFSAGEGFAILYLPTLDVRVPVAESVDPGSVLDNGMVGHYTEEDGLPTAMPWDEEGNVGLAGHRNTHGEPFRYINNLEPGDPIVIETESTYYTYEMRSRLDSTSPSNTAVLDPIPEQGGFTDPGRYVTLTTCTPEFTSTYRLIVWGELAEERPRAEGMPDALVN
ncbi:class E sortase [Streptomyces sp. 3MP-14]|uniref:Class E sortase n=1 Tax=Streptomyces mimosae TaxID=2586635 RepID=A0A5N6A5F2_9ACTN|nr:class E sortase [Streptomyces mimosae]KAB8174750.1 class E sortase [Streptomyces sp. 3MP-14]